jgi:hypothetical protein
VRGVDRAIGATVVSRCTAPASAWLAHSRARKSSIESGCSQVPVLGELGAAIMSAHFRCSCALGRIILMHEPACTRESLTRPQRENSITS